MSNTNPTFPSPFSSKQLRVWLAIACGWGALVVGCYGPSPSPPSPPAGTPQVEHDHGTASDHGHEAPASYADAVKQLESLRNTIRDAIGKKDMEAAHGPLHDVVHVLDALPALADKAGLDAKQKDILKGAMEQLMAHFGKIDEVMHGKEGIKYEDVSDGIDKAVAALVGLSATK